MALDTTDLLHFYDCDEASGDLIDAHGSADWADYATVTQAAGAGPNGQDVRDYDASLKEGHELYPHSDWDMLSTGSARTTCFWVYIDDDTLFSYLYTGDDFWNGGGWNFAHNNTANQLRVRAYTASGTRVVNGTKSGLTHGSWILIIMKWDPATGTHGRLSISFNGSSTWTTFDPSQALTGVEDSPIGLMQHPGGAAGTHTDGKLFGVSLWSRLFSNTDASDYYNGGDGIVYADLSSSNLAASGSLAVTGAADVKGGGALAASGSLAVTGAADVKGGGALAASGSLAVTGAADVKGGGALAASGSLAVTGAADVKGGGALAASGSLAVTGAADVKGGGALAASGSLAVTGAADVKGQSTLAASGSLAVAGAADVKGGGALAASGSLAVTGAADVKGGGALAASGSLAVTGAADVKGQSTLAASGSLAVAGAADVKGGGALAASGSLAVSGAADLKGAGALAASGVFAITGAAALTGFGTVTASGTIQITGAADLAGTGGIAAPGTIVFSGSATFVATAEYTQRPPTSTELTGVGGKARKMLRIPAPEEFSTEFESGKLNRFMRDIGSWTRLVRDRVDKLDYEVPTSFRGVNVDPTYAVPMGGPVCVIGPTAQFGVYLVRPASNDSPLTMPAAGLSLGPIPADGGVGDCVRFGAVRYLDSTVWGSPASGDHLYVDVKGHLTTTRPNHPDYVQSVARVLEASATDALMLAAVGMIDSRDAQQHEHLDVPILAGQAEPNMTGAPVAWADASGIDCGWGLPDLVNDVGVVWPMMGIPRGGGGTTEFIVEAFIHDEGLGGGSSAWVLAALYEWSALGAAPLTGTRTQSGSQTITDLASKTQRVRFTIGAGGVDLADAQLVVGISRLCTDAADTATGACIVHGLRVWPSMT